MSIRHGRHTADVSAEETRNSEQTIPPSSSSEAAKTLPPAPGASSEPTKTLAERQLEGARNYFEPMLDQLNLSIAKLDSQNLTQLTFSLEQLNLAIAHPENFGTVKLNFSIKFWVIQSSDESHVSIGILPILLERKRYILERMRFLEAESKVENLMDLIEANITNPKTKNEMNQKLQEIENLGQRYTKQGQLLDYQQQAILIEEKKQSIQISGIERKSKVYLSYLERESAATVIGGLILIIITVALVILLFFTDKALETISSGFLVILGYFFGQSSASKRSLGENHLPATGSDKP